jgi:capsular polysaccharide transport system permease protein
MALSMRVATISSLIKRDMVVRYGRENIGFAWLMVEPMILTVGVMTLWVIMKPEYEHGIQIVALVLTGYMPLTLFRHITAAQVNMMKASGSLLYHRPVSIWDIFLSRSLMEFGGTTIAFLVIYGILLVFGQIEPVKDWRLVISAWLLIGFFALAIGACFAAVTELSEVSERFVQTYQYLQVPLSGAFFMIDWMPSQVQNLLFYNPLVHGFEMIRAGFFGESVPTHYTPEYIFFWSVALLLIGLAGMKRARRTLHVT